MSEIVVIALAVMAAMFVLIVLFMRGARRLNSEFDEISLVGEEFEHMLHRRPVMRGLRGAGDVRTRPRRSAQPAD